MLVAERKETGTAITAPTKVPKKAMHIVSSKRYATPLVLKVNNNVGFGLSKPLNILAATE
jgi:hypothetical protein